MAQSEGTPSLAQDRLEKVVDKDCAKSQRDGVDRYLTLINVL